MQAFSPDGRWIVSTSVDGTVRTWDLPSGHAVDRFKVDQIATSVSFSPAGDFLATAHVNSVGICLWANRAQFSNVILRRVPDEEEITSVMMPSIHAVNEDDAMDKDSTEVVTTNIVEEEQDEGDVLQMNYQSPEQLAAEMITLSLEPKSKWQNLLNLETIKV